MEQFVLYLYTVCQSQSALLRKQKLEQKKEEMVPKIFDSVYSAVNAMLKTSNNQLLSDLILNSPRIKLRQSNNVILDSRDSDSQTMSF